MIFQGPVFLQWRFCWKGGVFNRVPGMFPLSSWGHCLCDDSKRLSDGCIALWRRAKESGSPDIKSNSDSYVAFLNPLCNKTKQNKNKPCKHSIWYFTHETYIHLYSVYVLYLSLLWSNAYQEVDWEGERSRSDDSLTELLINKWVKCDIKIVYESNSK